jgi:hypothetical protein
MSLPNVVVIETAPDQVGRQSLTDAQQRVNVVGHIINFIITIVASFTNGRRPSSHHRIHCNPCHHYLHHRLAGDVADMSRHVGDDTTCHSNFGQMGPCRRHKISDVVAVCVGSSRHFTKFSEFVCRNILLWYGSTYAQIIQRSLFHSAPLLPPTTDHIY